jgi:hypothetical protein
VDHLQNPPLNVQYNPGLPTETSFVDGYRNRLEVPATVNSNNPVFVSNTDAEYNTEENLNGGDNFAPSVTDATDLRQR